MTAPHGSALRGTLAVAAGVAVLVLSGGRRECDRVSDVPSSPGHGETHPAARDPRSHDPLPQGLVADLERGRVILTRHCGSCHSPGLPTTSPGALAVFSLGDEDWSAHMTPAQICASGRRMKGVSREPVEVGDYTQVIGRILAERGAPPCGT